MEYTVQKLSKIAGISSRALRYYDEIVLLKPARINSSGYRIYGQKEVDRLQQILFYRELGVSLESISDILASPSFNEANALREHRTKLIERREMLDLLISNVDKTLESKERSVVMNDKEKFEGFKKKLIDENEKKYGKEIREKYGDEAVNQSNTKLHNMTKEDFEKAEALRKEFTETLNAAFKMGDPAGELAQKASDLHRQWLSFYWNGYTKEAHAGLVQMYVDDERFKAHYDKDQPRTAEFLRDAVLIYTRKQGGPMGRPPK